MNTFEVGVIELWPNAGISMADRGVANNHCIKTITILGFRFLQKFIISKSQRKIKSLEERKNNNQNRMNGAKNEEKKEKQRF